MPLEIKELHIRVTVNQPKPGTAATPPAGDNKADDDKESIIAQCVEEVMDIMNAKKER